jgi:hypothetical protein
MGVNGAAIKLWEVSSGRLLRQFDSSIASMGVSSVHRRLHLEALAEGYDTQQMLDFLFTAGQCKLVSMVLNSAGVQLEEGFEGFSNETQG